MGHPYTVVRKRNLLKIRPSLRAQTGSLQEQIALTSITSERRGDLELRPSLAQAAEFAQEIAAHAR